MQKINDILGQHLYTTLIDNLNQKEYNSLEIGVFNGAGTAVIGRTFPNKTIYAIDPFIEDGNTDWITQVGEGNQLNIQKQNCYDNIKDLPNVILFEETSESFSKRLTKKMITEMNIGWVIIDGDHNYEPVTIDYELAIKIINQKKNSGIIFDDITLPGVKEAIDVFLVKYKDIITSLEYVNNVNMLIVKLY
jgi:hypothetical protein